MARLSPAELRDREFSEAAFQRGIVETAAWLGWSAVHWRPLQNRRGIWQVPFEGQLGKGWPDLTLVHPERGRLIFAECKRQLGVLSMDQIRVLDVLRELVTDDGRIEVHVWKPSDFRDPIEESEVYRVLSRR